MTTGMVLIIVCRHIDLSVGSLLAICSALMAQSQIEWLPQVFGLGNPVILVATIAFGLAVGTVEHETMGRRLRQASQILWRDGYDGGATSC